MINMDLALVEDEFDLQEIAEKQKCLKMYQQIKTELEAWEVVKKYTDYQDEDMFNCIPGGMYLIKPIKGQDFLIVKKALEAKE